jgi:hypothetical protein
MPAPTTPTAPVTETTQPETLADNDVVDESSRPHDGDHNQGGARPAGIDYQRELGTEQDA